MLYTLVDPDPGHEVAYNRWYERDHFYGGCMTGPWCFAGSRWVATRELKDLRFPTVGNSVNDPVDRGSYLAVYWVEDGHHDDHFAWGADQVVRLYRAGRGFQERRHAHTVLYMHRSNRYRDADPVPADVALDHHYAALATVVSTWARARRPTTWPPGWMPRACRECSQTDRWPCAPSGPPCPATR